MIQKRPTNVLAPAVVFVIAAGLTYLGVASCSTVQLKHQTRGDTLEGVDGLAEGEVIRLPELTTLEGKQVRLQSAGAEKFLFVFFTPACPGCTSDVNLWRSLNEEAAKRGAAFYLIDVGQDREALEKFVNAYELANLPILFDNGRRVGQTLKVHIVPQYLLVANDGKVLHRWDGLRRLGEHPDPTALAKFFTSGVD